MKKYIRNHAFIISLIVAIILVAILFLSIAFIPLKYVIIGILSIPLVIVLTAIFYDLFTER